MLFRSVVTESRRRRCTAKHLIKRVAGVRICRMCVDGALDQIAQEEVFHRCRHDYVEACDMGLRKRGTGGAVGQGNERDPLVALLGVAQCDRCLHVVRRQRVEGHDHHLRLELRCECQNVVPAARSAHFVATPGQQQHERVGYRPISGGNQNTVRLSGCGVQHLGAKLRDG